MVNPIRATSFRRCFGSSSSFFIASISLSCCFIGFFLSKSSLDHAANERSYRVFVIIYLVRNTVSNLRFTIALRCVTGFFLGAIFLKTCLLRFRRENVTIRQLLAEQVDHIVLGRTFRQVAVLHQRLAHTIKRHSAALVERKTKAH